MKKYLLVVGATCALGAVVCLLAKGSDQAPESAKSSESESSELVQRSAHKVEPPSALNASIRALARSVDAIAERLERLEGRAPDGNSNQPSPAVPLANRLSPDEQYEQEMTVAMERLDTINESFQSEPRDASWAPAREGELSEAFRGGAFAGSELLSSQCKKTFCRMEVRHKSREDQNAFELITRRVTDSYFIQHLEPDADGRSESYAFFLRPGHEQENVIAQAMAPVQ